MRDEIVVSWADEDVDQIVLETGVVGPSFLREVALLTDRSGYLFFADDPTDPDGLCNHFRVTRDALRQAANSILTGEHDVDQAWREAIECNEIDGVIAGFIIQVAMYGEVIY